MKRKTALVTGSSEGLGRAILLRLAAEGANVVINYHRNETAAKEVKTAAEAEGVRAIVVQADVSSVPDIPAHSQVAWPVLRWRTGDRRLQHPAHHALQLRH